MKTLTVAENIIEHLRFQIISGVLRPAQKLNEAALREELSVSSAPLREAFRVLGREGLIVSVPRKGSYVSGISQKDCQEIYEARRMMECFSVSLLEAEGIRELPELASCLDVHHEIQTPVNTSPIERYEYILERHQFHIRLVEAPKNLTLRSLYFNIFSRLLRYQYMYSLDFDPELTANLKEDHRKMYDAICRGDYEECRQTLNAHFTAFGELIERELARVNSGGDGLTSVTCPEFAWNFSENQ